MGIFIHMCVAKSVTKEEWEKVYEESLQLVEKFPLVNIQNVEIQGLNTTCLVKTKEKVYKRDYPYIEEWLGWDTVGDSISLKTAENFFLPRDLVGDSEVEKNAGDAMLTMIMSFLDRDNESESRNVYYLWGDKSQGERYHLYLLAIACLLEDRLKKSVYLWGYYERTMPKSC